MAIGPPTGMRDWLPQDTLLRQHLMDTIGSIYGLYGYLPIDTPAMEDLNVLLGKGGGENEKLLFKVLKRGEKLLEARDAGGDLADYGLRFDLTVPLARFVATHHGKLPRIFRRYHIGPVWRADRPQKGRFREFYQCDIDVVGGVSAAYEVEIITATERVLKELNLGPYWFRISDKRLLPLLLGGYGVPGESIPSVLVLLDKLGKISPIEFDELLNNILEKGSDTWRKVWQLIKVPETNKDQNVLLKKGTDYEHYEEMFRKVDNPSIASEISTIRDNLDQVISAVRQINPDSRIIFHPTLVRGMDYYTGPVYEAVVEGFSSSILGGGRYDGLIGKFLGRPLPAVGCSIGFERLLSILQERTSSGTRLFERVLLVRHNNDLIPLHRDAERLRTKGIPIETYLEEDDLGKQLKHAEAAGIIWAIKVIQPDGALLVRHLPTRRDRTVSLEEFQGLLRGLA